MQLMTDQDRRQKSGTKGIIFGEYGIGKTSLIRTLPEEETLVLDIEAGLKSVQGWQGKSLTINTWPQAKGIAAVISGPDSGASPGVAYSMEHYAASLKSLEKYLGADFDIKKYKTFFVDSISDLSRYCFKWCEQQAECYTQQGKLDIRKVYGLLALEMLDWFHRLQHAQNFNIWFAGKIVRTKTEDGSFVWELEFYGDKAKKAIPGIFDEIITLAEIQIKDKDGNVSKKRGFVCQKTNPWGYPAKTRSHLNTVEPAHLGKLMEKIENDRKMEFSYHEFLEDEIIY